MLSRSIQAQNAHILNNMVVPYNDYDYGKKSPGVNNFMASSGGGEHLPNIMGA